MTSLDDQGTKSIDQDYFLPVVSVTELRQQIIRLDRSGN